MQNLWHTQSIAEHTLHDLQKESHGEFSTRRRSSPVMRRTQHSPRSNHRHPLNIGKWRFLSDSYTISLFRTNIETSGIPNLPEREAQAWNLQGFPQCHRSPPLWALRRTRENQFQAGCAAQKCRRTLRVDTAHWQMRGSKRALRKRIFAGVAVTSN